MDRRVAVRGLYRNQPNIAPIGLPNSASQAKPAAAALGFEIHRYLDSMDGAQTDKPKLIMMLDAGCWMPPI